MSSTSDDHAGESVPTVDVEELAIGIYLLMGGKRENWLKEAAVFREEYRHAAQGVADAPTRGATVSDHCGNCGDVVLTRPRYECPCGARDCPIGDGFVCGLCDASIRKNMAHSGSTARSGGDA